MTCKNNILSDKLVTVVLVSIFTVVSTVSCSKESTGSDSSLFRFTESSKRHFEVLDNSSLASFRLSSGNNIQFDVTCYTTTRAGSTLLLDGEYTAGDEFSETAFTFRPGSYSSGAYSGTYLIENDGIGNSFSSLFNSGSFTVTNGNRKWVRLVFDLTSETGENLEGLYEGVLNFDRSTLDGDLVMTFTETGFMTFRHEGNYAAVSDTDLWTLSFFTADNAVESDEPIAYKELRLSLLSWVQTSADPPLPTGTFTMRRSEQRLAAYMVIPGDIDNPTGEGSWIFENDGERLFKEVPLAPDKGQISISRAVEDYTVSFEFYDNYDNRITGSFSGKRGS